MASWTQGQLDALNAAIAEGVLTVKYRDRTVTYRSLEEMLRLQDRMQRALGLTSANGGRKLFSFRKGTE